MQPPIYRAMGEFHPSSWPPSDEEAVTSDIFPGSSQSGLGVSIIRRFRQLQTSFPLCDTLSLFGKSQPTGRYLPQAVGSRGVQAWPEGAVTLRQTWEVGSDPHAGPTTHEKEPGNKAPALRGHPAGIRGKTIQK